MVNFKRRLLMLVFLSASASLSARGAGALEADQGEALAAQCQACHTFDEGAGNRIGPNLYGVFGAKAGSAPEFSYSDAMKAANIVWSEKTLDAFLTDPAKRVPGTKMGFPGIDDPKQRAAVIAYLKQATAKP